MTKLIADEFRRKALNVFLAMSTGSPERKHPVTRLFINLLRFELPLQDSHELAPLELAVKAGVVALVARRTHLLDIEN